VREAARLRLACLVSPALQALHDIIKDKTHPQRLRAIKEVLERSELYALGVEPHARSGFQPAITVQTQVNIPEVSRRVDERRGTRHASEATSRTVAAW
jgi:hypothetical protein